MTIILILGIALIAVPVLGFIIAGSLFLIAALQEDAGDKVFPGLLASIGLGVALLVIYATLKYFVH